MMPNRIAWDILPVLITVAGNLCNKCSYSKITAVKEIISMRSLVSIEQQSPRRPCDITKWPPCSERILSSNEEPDTARFP